MSAPVLHPPGHLGLDTMTTTDITAAASVAAIIAAARVAATATVTAATIGRHYGDRGQIETIKSYRYKKCDQHESRNKTDCCDSRYLAHRWIHIQNCCFKKMVRVAHSLASDSIPV